MTDIGEAVGTTVEGGLFARALSRSSGPGAERTDGHFQETVCLNCGTPLIGAHCHDCGQAAHLHRTLGALGHDLMHGVLHLDGKAWRTLPLLAWRPGDLTRRYIHGERAKFVSPMALFLFSIFLMFAVFQAIGIDTPDGVETRNAITTEMAADLAKLRAERDRLRTQLAQAAKDSSRYRSIESRLSAVDEDLAVFQSAKTLVLDSENGAAITFADTGIAFFDRTLDKWRENPGLMLYKLQANSYKFSWLLIPLSLPFMWLLFFWKRGVRMYDHAIFVTYSIAFMSLLFVALSLLGTLGAPETVLVTGATAVPLIHLARHLKGTYGLSRRSAAWRLCALTVLIMIVIMLFLQILLVLGAF